MILFVGDGMGISTVTASRIFEGQLGGKSGEENVLSFERLPYTALIKTYNTDQQTPDSAGTMTAIVTGVKTRAGALSVSQAVQPGDHARVAGNRLATIVELAERAGLSTGIVTTTHVTHATPAACYAHSPDRYWEDDSAMPPAAVKADFPDIARQLVEFPFGDGMDIVLGGGRRHFLPAGVSDPEYGDLSGFRNDGRDLTAEWSDRPLAAYVWNKAQFDDIDVTVTGHLLGLFEHSHMHFEHDRADDAAGEPSLSAMTSKAIDLLSRNPKGYFLMVEGGRIDHAHHAANAYRALTETIEFARAVEIALNKTDSAHTLVIVTADHDHSLAIVGHAVRGNPILGKVMASAAQGEAAGAPGGASSRLAVDALGLPYTALVYASGPGYTGASLGQPEGPKHAVHWGCGFQGITMGRPDLTDVDTQSPDYLQECAIPMLEAAHSGADVAVYAGGPRAHLFHGVLEQNVIFHVMIDALGLPPQPVPGN
ncbi:MAG: alkaline phosphatase [Phycisphaerae bacterium]